MDALCQRIYPTIQQVEHVVERAIEVLQKEPNMVTREFPLIVVGDLFGSFEDLRSVFEIHGMPRETSYIFLGNYVDKGPYSLFVFLYLLCLKALNPDHVTLLRGAHETQSLNKLYGFAEECRRHYKTDKIWKKIAQVYKHLPIACLISEVNVT